MFTGIVSDVGTITSVDQRGDVRVAISCAYDMSNVDMGASISCAGICLTVVDKGNDWFAVDVSGETLSCTATGQFTVGRKINLERALKVGEELGGHIVTGHIDGVGEVVSTEATGDSQTVNIRITKELAPYIAAKGSITVDGVSLTVNDISDSSDGAVFALNIIPHTAKVTTLGELTAGRQVNLEIDILARYLSRMEQVRSAGDPPK